MDPGNRDYQRGRRGLLVQHTLPFVILISSLIAMQLQQMAGKLGIVTRMISASNAHHAPKMATSYLWVIVELALMATDLAEVLDRPSLKPLKFGIPIMGSHFHHGSHVFLLGIMKLRFKKIEAIVSTLI